jgi:hypothetical protein
MGIELFWDDDDQSVLLCEISGRWTWVEMFATLRTIKKITDKVDYEISAIIHVRSSTTFPGGSLLTSANMENARKMLKMGEGGTGPMVVVGANALVRTVCEAIAKLEKQATSNVRFADSVEQARVILYGHNAPVRT